MANRYCTKCGREVLAGKRFCGGCGQAMPVAETTVVEDVAAAPVCMRCGAELAPGKRFCKQCGQPADAGTAATVFEQPLSAQTCVELPEEAAEVPAPVAGGHAPTVVMESSYPERFSPESASTSQWEPVHAIEPPWTTSSAAITAPAPLAVPGDQSKMKIILAVGLAAAVLAAAGGGWAWYAHAHRSISNGTGLSAQSPQSPAQPSIQEQASAAPGATAQLAKPNAGVAAEATPPAQQTPIKPAPSVPTQPPISRQSGHGNPAAPTPAFHGSPSRPVPLPAPLAQERSGIRHYEGPPIPHGGTVVFDNLPKARLRFAYDHTQWQLTIRPNPDGTKKVTMISLAQGAQSSCDLGWEIVE